MASIYRAIGIPLPSTMTNAGKTSCEFSRSCSREYMPFDLVIDEETAGGTKRGSRRPASAEAGARSPARSATSPTSWEFRGRRSKARRSRWISCVVMRRLSHSWYSIRSGSGRRSRCAGGWSTSASISGRRSRRSIFSAGLAGRRRDTHRGGDGARRRAARCGEAKSAADRRDSRDVAPVRRTDAALGLGELTALYEAARDMSLAHGFQAHDLDLTPELEALVPAAIRARYSVLPRPGAGPGSRRRDSVRRGAGSRTERWG